MAAAQGRRDRGPDPRTNLPEARRDDHPRDNRPPVGACQLPAGETGASQVEASVAGKIASGIEVVVRPIGFNHDIALALLPAMAAREVAVSAIATVYSIDSSDEEVAATKLEDRLKGRWSLATLAFLAWFVFAPQCISTIAVASRDQRLEVAAVHDRLFVRPRLRGRRATYWTAVALGYSCPEEERDAGGREQGDPGRQSGRGP